MIKKKKVESQRKDEKFLHIKEGEYCATFWKKFRGLMFSRPKNLIFVLDREMRWGAIVHMFFVFYPIDVYWLDKNKCVVDKRIHLKPFHIAIPRKKAQYIIERKGN